MIYLRKNKYWLLLFLLIIFLEITTFWWLKLDAAPPWWDQSWYLENSQRFYHALKEQGFRPFWDAFTHAFGNKVPLISLLPLPFYFIFGNSEMAAMGVNLVFVAIFCLFLFLLVKKIIGEKEAFLAVLLTSTMPLVFGLSRQFLVEYGLLSLVVIWLYFLILSDYFRKTVHNLLLGIFLGLGLLMKVSFPLFVFGPALVVFIGRFKKGSLKKLPLDLGLILLPAFIIAYPWYSKNFSSVFKFAISTSFGEISKDYAIGDIFSFRTIYAYWQNLINFGFSAYYFFLCAFLFFVFLFLLVIKKAELNLLLLFIFS